MDGVATIKEKDDEDDRLDDDAKALKSLKAHLSRVKLEDLVKRISMKMKTDLLTGMRLST